MSSVARLSVRVFIEGIEVPNNGVSIEADVNEGMNVTVSLVPGNYAKKLVPRSLVHVFVQDPYEGDAAKWYCAFEGEYVAKQYSKSGSSKSFVASNVDFSSYFDSAKAFFFNPRNSGYQTDNVNQVQTISQITRNAPKDQVKISTTLTAQNFMMTLMRESINKSGEFSTAVRDALKQLSSGNAFLRLAETRLRISDRILSETAGAGLKRYLGFKFAGNAIDFMYNESIGGVSTLRELMVSVLQYTFHDMVCMPFPSLVNAPSDMKYAMNGKTIGNIILKPNVNFLPPPKCNVVFPSMYTNMSYSHNYLNDITRLTYRPQIVSPGIGPDGTQITSAQSFVYYPDSYAAFMGNKAQPVIDEDSPLAVAKVYGPIYKKKFGSKKFSDVSNDDAENKLTDDRINAKLRQNDFLTNEEAIRGITDETIGSFPGIGQILGKGDSSERKNYFEKTVEYVFFKKRFEHKVFPLSMVFNPHLALGFPILVVDDNEDFNNTIVGYLSKISHQIYPGAASTSVVITYARELDEIQEMTGKRIEPPIPPWFDADRWGSVDKTKTLSETTRMAKTGYSVDKTARASGVIQFTKVSATYLKLLGVSSITNDDDAKTVDIRQSTEGAAAAIIVNYRNAKANGEDAEKDFVRNYIRRPLVDMESSFLFIDAVAQLDNNQKDITQDFLKFVGTKTGPRKANVFDGSLSKAEKTTLFGKGFEYLTNEEIIKKKQQVVQQYADELKYSSGQRG